MSQPSSDHVYFHPCLEEVDRRRVPENVGRDPTQLVARLLTFEDARMATDQLVDAEARERTATMGDEYRRLSDSDCVFHFE